MARTRCENARRRPGRAVEDVFDRGRSPSPNQAKKHSRVLELGCGTGRFSQAILKAMPQVHLTVLDVDKQILAQARRRLSPFEERVTFLEGDFESRIPPADAIAAALSLHHVRDLNRKTKVYQGIHEALGTGGLFLNLDATVSAETSFSELTFARWVAFMETHGIAETEARGHLAHWK